MESQAYNMLKIGEIPQMADADFKTEWKIQTS